MMINGRDVEHDILAIFPNRWSPRAMSGESVSGEELMRIFEAARWAPSSYNNQPWRFVYAFRGSEHWDRMFGLLSEGNQAWCVKAGALIVMASKDTFDHDGKPSITHSFDTGAAWENMALQGSSMGLVVHAMQGFDYRRAAVAVGMPDGYSVEAMVAVGKPGKKEDLPAGYAERESVSSRKKVEEFCSEGRFLEGS